MSQLILMSHVFFGIVCIVAAMWLFVDVIHVGEGNLARIRRVSLAAAASFWIAFIIGGYWYVTAYKADKETILKGPWPFAHNMIMETKEHLVIMLLLLVTYLPVAAADRLDTNPGARRLMLWITGLIVILALAMDGEGGLIAMGVKVGLLAK